MQNDIRQAIEAAAEQRGGMLALADYLGMKDTHLHNIKAGTRTCSPEVEALIRAAAGENFRTAHDRALLAKHEGTKMGERLARAMGKALAGALVTLSFGYGAHVPNAEARGMTATDRANVYRGRRRLMPA